ncbi:GNAT family N-acetyltransferase [Marinobacterium lutimaris]|uniref:ElaA protein n=1 Tax=Marinobacterium lutimaris TaxID=568106 RepID=A0A1H5WF84_9GAMM|nr:GNAT family N-acetyltransferase [Marinobacterium lutimaris]SEF97936.1 ElaA protein [Marinobacterium lutimaris]
MTSNQTVWKLLTFSRFDAPILESWLQLRQTVFVVEQRCAYPDIDGRDADALHLLGFVGDRLAAGARLFAPREEQLHAQIGRVVVAVEQRGSGLGKTLMQEALDACLERWPESPIKISAQAHLEHFYNSLGFRTISDQYDEDGIPHIDMEYRLK